MRLIIAEKPSLGRAIAAVLPGPQRREQGLVRCGEDTVVSWCIGHLLEPAEPAAYNPQWQRWRLDTLPLFPEQWRWQPRPKVEAQLRLLEKLIAGAKTIVHAGDPDREGQLLVDEVLRWSDCTVPVRRILVNDLNPEAVRRALAQHRDNNDFRSLSASAEARQQADWLYGLNLTRACTLLKRQKNEQGVFSVGRVQTPVLGLVVERDRQIEDFVAVSFYRIQAQVQPSEPSGPATAEFMALWQPGEAYAAHLDPENRLLDQTVADSIAASVAGSDGTITAARFRERPEPPPLPLSLSALQIEAGRHHQLSAQDVLDAAQALYENHRLITYPRSDSRYLPEGHWPEAPGVIAAIGTNLPDLTGPEAGPDCPVPDPAIRGRAWDDAKVEAHHAIIPTRRQLPASRLAPAQLQVYRLICRFYLMQFLPDAIHRDGRLECRFGEHRFLARETGVIVPGWQALAPRRTEPDKAPAPPLPRLEKGAAVHARDCTVASRKTQPPQPFTDATLLAAMTGIARFVTDPALRKTLRDTDGLGTEATRAGIIETLFRREYLVKAGRHIHATERGRQLIAELPKAVSAPDRTAHWESTLEQVRFGQAEPAPFLAQLRLEIQELIGSIVGPAASTNPDQLAPADADANPRCPRCHSPMRQRKGPYGEFWSCQRYPQCRGTRRPDDKLAQTDGTQQAPVACPHCLAPLKRREGPRGFFWGCSQFPACRQTVPDRNGAPLLPQKTGRI